MSATSETFVPSHLTSLSTQHLQLPKTHCRILPEKRGFCSSAKSLFGSPASSCHGLSQWVSPSNFELALSLFCSVRRLPFMFSNYWAFSQCRFNFLWCHHQSEGWGHPISKSCSNSCIYPGSTTGWNSQITQCIFSVKSLECAISMDWQEASQWIGIGQLGTIHTSCQVSISYSEQVSSLPSPFWPTQEFLFGILEQRSEQFLIFLFISSRFESQEFVGTSLSICARLHSWSLLSKKISVVSANRQNDEYDIHSDLAPDNFTSHTLTMDN